MDTPQWISCRPHFVDNRGGHTLDAALRAYRRALREGQQQFVFADVATASFNLPGRGLVKEELAQRKWSEEGLGQRPRPDRPKARIALRLRRGTTMTLAWIAGRLRVGSVNRLRNPQRVANSRD